MDIRDEWVYLEGLMSHPRRDASPTLLDPTFLDEVLETILAHPVRTRALHRLAVVVPSHRVMTKLRHALETIDRAGEVPLIPRPFWIRGRIVSVHRCGSTRGDGEVLPVGACGTT